MNDLDSLHFLAVMNDAAVNVLVQVVHVNMFSFLLDIYLGVELLGRVVPLCLTF